MAENKNENKDKISLRVEILENIRNLVTGGLGLVAALAWNVAIKSAFSAIFPEPGNNLIAQTGYALVITIVVVIFTVQIGKAVNIAKKGVTGIKKK